MITSHADPDSLVQTAVALHRQGRFRDAESCCRKALKARPGHRGATNMLAICLMEQGQHDKASRLLADLARREPRNVGHWINLGTTLRSLHRLEEALAAYEQAAALGESSADFLYNFGLAHVDLGNFDAAKTILGRAAQLAPRDPQICYQYAFCCDQMMCLDEAIEALQPWRTWHGLTTDMLARVGALLMKLGELSSARQAVELALHDPEPSAEASLAIVQVQERTNQLAEARQRLARLQHHPGAEKLGPDLKQIEARLAERDGRLDEAIGLYGEVLGETPEFHRRHHALFPLAKTLDAAGRHDEAFAALEEAHASQVAYMKLTMPQAPAWNQEPFAIASLDCSPEDVAAWDGAGAPDVASSPVFIVGFPRSGTTLLEQTLDAHPSLVSMDETRFLYEVLDEMNSDDSIIYPAGLAALKPKRLEELRASYWSRVRTRVSVESGQRLVDKNPLNLLALPAIQRLFPNARIVLAIRHPCDVILSCFMQHFLSPGFLLMCRDLPSLSHGYRRAFDYWYRQSAILQPTVFELRYEDFVTGFEQRVRSVADFLELPWTDAMLRPGEHAQRKGFISTPSYTQVVKPVNTRAVGRWRAYENQFRSILADLRPYIERWGYQA